MKAALTIAAVTLTLASTTACRHVSGSPPVRNQHCNGEQWIDRSPMCEGPAKWHTPKSMPASS